MKAKKLFWVCVCCPIAAVMAWGQVTNARPAAQEFQLSALPTYTGTVYVTLTITVKTASLTSISCTAHVFVDDAAGSGAKHNEYDTVAASGTGTTRTCSLKIPYAWSLGGQPYDYMYSDYSVSGMAGTTSGLPKRTVSVDLFDSRSVPPNWSPRGVPSGNSSRLV